MKFFRIPPEISPIGEAQEPSFVIVEPKPKANGSPSVIYAGSSFVVLLSGKFGKGTKGIDEVDPNDAEVKVEIRDAILGMVVDVSELDAATASVLALVSAPPLEIARSDALEAVKAAHEKSLVQLSGGASVAERDTWPNQKDWAFRVRDLNRCLAILDTIVKALPDTLDDLSPIVAEITVEIAEAAHSLSGLLTLEEIAELEADEIDPSEFMASKIIAKVRAMGLLITTATRIKRTGEAAIAKASTVAELASVMTDLEAQSEAAMAAFVTQTSGG